MATFFEYLQQRSFEAIFGGVQEAVNVLEGSRSDAPTEIDGLQFDSPELSELLQRLEEDASRFSMTDEKPAPAPRRRGRPRKKPVEDQQ